MNLNWLPNEILCQISFFLTEREILSSLSLVDKRFYHISRSEELYYHLCKGQIGKPIKNEEELERLCGEHNNSWKKLYKFLNVVFQFSHSEEVECSGLQNQFVKPVFKSADEKVKGKLVYLNKPFRRHGESFILKSKKIEENSDRNLEGMMIGFSVNRGESLSSVSKKRIFCISRLGCRPQFVCLGFSWRHQSLEERKSTSFDSVQLPRGGCNSFRAWRSYNEETDHFKIEYFVRCNDKYENASRMSSACSAANIHEKEEDEKKKKKTISLKICYVDTDGFHETNKPVEEIVGVFELTDDENTIYPYVGIFGNLQLEIVNESMK